MRCAVGFMLGAALLISGCAGKVDYQAPVQPASLENSKTVGKSKEQVWTALIPKLSEKFFVINNLDKSSGFINISYAGSPSTYVDCGYISSYVKNARGERTYYFAASSANETYEALTDGLLLFVNRKTSLEGRMNIVIIDEGADKAKVSVNTRYILTIEALISNVQGLSSRQSNTIAFNTGTQGKGQTISCFSTGSLEREVLSLLPQ